MAARWAERAAECGAVSAVTTPPGGGAARSVVGWFHEYAATVAERLGDRVRNWMVFNEPGTFVLAGHLAGVHAPGVRSLRRTLAATHHVNLAQAAGAAAVRAAAPQARVGTTHIVVPTRTAADSPRHRRAAAAVDALVNRMFLEPNFGLGYPTDANDLITGVHRHQRAGDDADIRVSWDFLGVQYYTRVLVRPVPIPRVHGVPWPSRDHRRFELTAMGWEVQPDGIREALHKVSALDPELPLVVTENGAAFPDHLTGDRVHDPRRITFYRDHLAEVRRARAEGVPVHGYFCWSLLDNFEWAQGYGPRFGLTYVDYATQRRVVKDSGRWFQAFLAG